MLDIWHFLGNDKGYYWFEHKIIKTLAAWSSLLRKCIYVKIGQELLRHKFYGFWTAWSWWRSSPVIDDWPNLISGEEVCAGPCLCLLALVSLIFLPIIFLAYSYRGWWKVWFFRLLLPPFIVPLLCFSWGIIETLEV